MPLAATDPPRIRVCTDEETHETHQLREDEDSDVQRGDDEPDERSRAAATRASEADVSSLFANIRSAKANVASSAATVPLAATDPARIQVYTDENKHETQQLREDEGSDVQRSDDEPDERNRAVVTRALKADVSSLFAKIRKANASAAQSVFTAGNKNAPEESSEQCQTATANAVAKKKEDGDCQCSDGEPDEAGQSQQQRSDREPAQQSRAAVARALKADVAALFATVRRAKPSAGNQNAL